MCSRTNYSSQVLTTKNDIDSTEDDPRLDSKCIGDFRHKALRQDHRNLTMAYSHGSKVLARLRTPGWLPIRARALELLCGKARFGWDFSIRPYNIVYRGSDIYQFGTWDDISTIQELFHEGKASPFDRFADGSTLVDVSISHVGFFFSTYCTYVLIPISSP